MNSDGSLNEDLEAPVTLSGAIAKTQDDEHLVFGWANVVKNAAGETIVDKQDDFWESVADLEETAYDYVLHSRDGGDTHLRKGVSTLVESFVVTPEKLQALGMPGDALPQGWWVGFKVHDEDVWKGVKSDPPKYTGFSIGGSGQRVKGQTPVGKVAKRDVSTQERDRLAGQGKALPDGSFPIANESDLKNAISAFGRAKDKGAAKAHIMRRAKALGCPELIPESWVSKSDPLLAAIHAASVVKHLPGRHNQLSHGVDRMIADWKYVRDNATDPARVAHAETQLKRLADTKAAMESSYQRDLNTPPAPDRVKNTPVIYQPVTSPEQAADIAARRRAGGIIPADSQGTGTDEYKGLKGRFHDGNQFTFNDGGTVPVRPEDYPRMRKSDPLLRALGAVAKHLQGQHNQQDHANKGKKALNWAGNAASAATSAASSSSSSSSSASSSKPTPKKTSSSAAKKPASTSGEGQDLLADLEHNGVPLKDALTKINPEGKPDGAGTADDPIDVGKDLDKAVRLLSEGKHVRLRQTSEVSTLLDKLAKEVQKAKDAGKDAPNIDLCKVSVPGTNLFCHDSKGIPRAKMPQFKGRAAPGSRAESKVGEEPGLEADVEPEFRAALSVMGIKVTDKTVPAARLRATQSELVGPKVAGMVSSRLAGKFPDEPWNKPIYVTRDGYIIDGHHRWAAKVGVDAADGTLGDEPMAVYEVDMDIGTAIDFANAFTLAMGITPKGTGADAEGVKKLAEQIRKARQRDTTPCFGCR
jgi:hypothetical protein